MNITDDDFTLMGLPQRFAIDANKLDQHWREMQSHVHPDRFASQGAVAQRMAMQWSTRINEAYRRLQQPIARAAYLCQLHGIDIQAQHNTRMPLEFLMQQMAWREALDEAHEPQDIQALLQTVESAAADIQVQIERLIDIQADYTQAAQQVRAWMFIDKFLHDVTARHAALT